MKVLQLQEGDIFSKGGKGKKGNRGRE